MLLRGLPARRRVNLHTARSQNRVIQQPLEGRAFLLGKTDSEVRAQARKRAGGGCFYLRIVPSPHHPSPSGSASATFPPFSVGNDPQGGSESAVHIGKSARRCCAISSTRPSVLRPWAALPLLRWRGRGRRRFAGDRWFGRHSVIPSRHLSGSARRWVLFFGHGLLLIPWKLFTLKTPPSRLRRRAPPCRRHLLRECVCRHEAILPPRSKNVLHPGDSAILWASRKDGVHP